MAVMVCVAMNGDPKLVKKMVGDHDKYVKLCVTTLLFHTKPFLVINNVS